jgi:hypothetical protein
VLNRDQADENAVTFSWTPYDLTWSNPAVAYEGAVNYVLQFDRPGNNFASPVEVAVGNNRQRAYTAAEYNALLGQLEMEPGTAAPLVVRLMVQIGPNQEPVYSNLLTVTATPYLDVIEYPSMYVPGSHQNWSPATAPKVSLFGNNVFYEGYVYFPAATNEFKITPEPNWDNDYGSAGTPLVEGLTTSGTLAESGGNLRVAGAGYYRLRVNLVANEWIALRTTWGVIGSGTAGGWDADQDLTFNPTANVWRATMPLTAGEIKFRANADWGINFGDNDANGLLEYNGANIKVEEAGNYEVTLDVSIPGNYTYRLRKL